MARKDFHIYTNDPDVISKIDNFEAYGFTNRNAFIIEAVRSYGMIATPEPTLRTLITESVAQGLLSVLNIDTDAETNSDQEENEILDYASLIILISAKKNYVHYAGS